MSQSSRTIHGENDSSRVNLPVFITPTDLVFAFNKRRCSLTVFNPYGNEAKFCIMTTSPDRFDFSVTKGIIKPNRRIEIIIRLLPNKVEELPQPTDELQSIDYFKVALQVGQLKGNRSLRVYWCINTDLVDTSGNLSGPDETKSSILKLKSSSPSPPTSTSSVQATTTGLATSAHSKTFSQQRSPLLRSNRQLTQANHPQVAGSNVNLVCTMCAIACVITLFLPLAIDSELCKKVRTPPDDAQQTGLLSSMGAIFSVSYEMKLGCSFALGLFTYRLISTLPD